MNFSRRKNKESVKSEEMALSPPASPIPLLSQESQTTNMLKESVISNVSLVESPFIEDIKTAMNLVSFCKTVTDFESRYEKEFEHQRLIGKGGFGYVFEAKHRIDEKKYAIKRISLKDK